MNCPQCHETVAPDAFGYSVWRPERCGNCNTSHEVRDLFVSCGHCGVHHAIEHRPTGNVTDVRCIDRHPLLKKRARRFIAALETAEAPA